MVMLMNQNVIWETGGVTDNKSENMRETIFGAQMEKLKTFLGQTKITVFQCFFKNIFRFIFVPEIFLFRKDFYLALYVIRIGVGLKN